jgi:dTDP-6-deoxy-L-talose 4-dehydrogenase [NAD(P)+]
MDLQSHTTSRGLGKRAVVLGGTGFIGRSVCGALAHLGYEVVAVARRADPVAEAGKVVPFDLAFGTHDEILDILRDIDVDVIVNAAGGTWGRSDDELYAANLGLTERILSAAAALPTTVRLVHVGSVHEYGLVPVGDSMPEELVPSPVTEYGRLKARCTEAVLMAARAGQVDAIVLRIGNVTGAGQPAASLLGTVAGTLRRAHLEGRPAVLELGPLGSQRDFLNRRDATAAIVAAATVDTVAELLVNIGRGTAASARSMVELLIEASGVPTELREQPAKAPETHWQQMRIERARRVLGWAPGEDGGQGVRELWQSLISAPR